MNNARFSRQRKLFAPIIIAAVVAVVGSGLGTYRYDRELPALEVSVTAPTVEAKQEVTLPWNDSGESAISTADGKRLGIGPNADKVVPTASIAKLITIMTVLKKYPLKAGETGPTITMTPADVDLYKYYKAIGGSNVIVKAGQQFTEYQMIQAMMLPSANNFADSLAVWAYGSLADYKTAAQDVVNRMGMGKTLVGSDASGFLPDTTSTANDLVLLGQAALKESVVTEIAGQELALLPNAGTVRTTDTGLGQSGITGLKTGTSDQAGNCFLFSATHTFNNGKTETFVGVVMHSESSQSRFTEATNLLEATYNAYQDVVVAKAGTRVGTVKSAWGQEVDIVTAKDVTQFAWIGDRATVEANASVGDQEVLDKGEPVGSIKTANSTVPLVTNDQLSAPSFGWRILH